MSVIGAARLSAIAGLLGWTTCGSSMYVRRPLTPSPSPACLEGAFRESPRVRHFEVHPPEGRWGASYGLEIWDPEARDSVWRSGVHLEPAPDSSTLVSIEFIWGLLPTEWVTFA